MPETDYNRRRLKSFNLRLYFFLCYGEKNVGNTRRNMNKSGKGSGLAEPESPVRGEGPMKKRVYSVGRAFGTSVMSAPQL